MPGIVYFIKPLAIQSNKTIIIFKKLLVNADSALQKHFSNYFNDLKVPKAVFQTKINQ